MSFWARSMAHLTRLISSCAQFKCWLLLWIFLSSDIICWRPSIRWLTTVSNWPISSSILAYISCIYSSSTPSESWLSIWNFCYDNSVSCSFLTFICPIRRSIRPCWIYSSVVCYMAMTWRCIMLTLFCHYLIVWAHDSSILWARLSASAVSTLSISILWRSSYTTCTSRSAFIASSYDSSLSFSMAIL